MPTSDDLMRLARDCADQITPPRKTTQFPSFAEVEEQCGDGYEELLALLHEEELFQPADLDEQERLVEAIKTALGERQELIEQLVDNQAAQVWLQQEGAFHLGVAVGLRLAEEGYTVRDEDEDEEPLDDIESEDAVRFGKYRYDPVRDYDEEEDEEEEDGEDR